MQILSMTGCGRGEEVGGFGRIVVELSSVNAKYLDINLRCPSLLGPLVEHQMREAIGLRMGRGRINGLIILQLISRKENRPFADVDLAKAYQTELDGLLDQLDIVGQVDLNTLIRQPGVLSMVGDAVDSTVINACMVALAQALDDLITSRAKEGKKLLGDINKRLKKIGNLVGKVKVMAPGNIIEAKKRLQARIAELCKIPLDVIRLEQEITMLAERLDITEELVRLAAHLGEFEKIITKGGRIGRKMDFMLQELLREWNTITNKANESKINHLAVEAKDILEQIREQVQNVE